MNLAFTCHSCGETAEVSWSQIGQKVMCDGCGATSTVPAPMETVGEEASPPRALRFACPACGRKFSTRTELAGKKIRCNGCGAGVRIPGIEGTGASTSRPNLRAAGAAEVEPAPTPARAGAANEASRFVFEPEPVDPSSLFEDLAAVEGANRARRAESVLSPRSAMIEQARRQTEPQADESTQDAEKEKKEDRWVL
jgi:DNA-directed RNA polymerase subunit RPC12/RpoP